MIDLQVLNTFKSLFSADCEAIFPVDIEVLHVFLSDRDIFLHLRLLNVRAKGVLIDDNFGFKKSDFLHQVLIQLVFLDFAALEREQLHFFLNGQED